MTYTSKKLSKNLDTEWNPDSFCNWLGFKITVRYGQGSWLPTATGGDGIEAQEIWKYDFSRGSEASSHKREGLELRIYSGENLVNESQWCGPSSSGTRISSTTECSSIRSWGGQDFNDSRKRAISKWPFKRSFIAVKRYFFYFKLKRAVAKLLHSIHPFWNSHVKIVAYKGNNFLYMNVLGCTDTGKHIEKEFKDKSVSNKEILKQMFAYVQIMDKENYAS